jgi:hypothetical protein
MRRENWVALGLVLILVGGVFLVFSYSSTNLEDFTVRGSVDNSGRTTFDLNVSGVFEAGEHFAFNFTKGRYWGLDYESSHQGLEPSEGNFSGSNIAIPAYKEAFFDIFTPSSDVFSVDVYCAEGQFPFAVVYENQSSDFTPLNGENYTLRARVDGVTNRAGTYTVKATLIFPQVMRDETHTYEMAGDPPQLMNLWNIQHVETKPYFLGFATLGAIFVVSGIVIATQGRKGKKKRRSHEAKTVTSVSE